MVKPVVTHLGGCQGNVKHTSLSVHQYKMQLRLGLLCGGAVVV